MDLVVLMGIALIVGLVILLVVRSRRPRKTADTFLDAMSASYQQRMEEQARQPWGTRRLVVDPEVSFASLDQSLSRLGARQSAQGPAHEPERATWAKDGLAIHYVYHAGSGLRGLELHSRGDEGARALVQDIVNGLYLSTIEHRAVELLGSQVRRELVLGLHAVEFLGNDRMTEGAPPVLEALRSHPDPEIAAHAARVLGKCGAATAPLTAPAPDAPASDPNRRVLAVGYTPEDRTAHFSCAIEPNQHIHAWEVEQLRQILVGRRLPNGDPVDRVSVLFPTRGDAEREHGALGAVGVQVLYYDDRGERAELRP